MKKVIPFLSALLLLLACNSNSAEKQKEPQQQEQELKIKEPAVQEKSNTTPVDTVKAASPATLNELSNKENLLGFWFVPHNATVNIRFTRDGRFSFNDFNTTLEKEELLEGSYQLDNGTLTLLYDDRPKQKFRFYRGEKNDDNYYIKNNSGYYFVKGESGDGN